MKLKLLTPDEERATIATAIGTYPVDMHTVGNITGKALKEAQARLTLNQICDILEKKDWFGEKLTVNERRQAIGWLRGLGDEQLRTEASK